MDELPRSVSETEYPGRNGCHHFHQPNRIGIAQAILHDPRIVFLDEPMSGLDPVGRREVRDLIEGLRDDGKTVFFSTHILSDAETLCDRVAVLNKGELRGITVVSDLVTKAAGQSEVLADGITDVSLLRSLSSDVRASGTSLRVVAPVGQVDAIIDAIRRSNGRLISINPLRGSLEDYFLKHLDDGATPAEGKQP